MVFSAVPWEERAVGGKSRGRAIELELILGFGSFQLIRLVLAIVLEVDATEIQVFGFQWAGVLWLDHYQLLRLLHVEKCLVDSGFSEIRLDDVQPA